MISLPFDSICVHSWVSGDVTPFISRLGLVPTCLSWYEYLIFMSVILMFKTPWMFYSMAGECKPSVSSGALAKKKDLSPDGRKINLRDRQCRLQRGGLWRDVPSRLYIIWSSYRKFGTEPRVNWGSAKTLTLLDALRVGTQIFIDYRKDAFMSLLVGDYWDDTAFQDTLPTSKRWRRIMNIAMAIALLTDITYVILRMTPKDRCY